MQYYAIPRWRVGCVIVDTVRERVCGGDRYLVGGGGVGRRRRKGERASLDFVIVTPL